MTSNIYSERTVQKKSVESTQFTISKLTQGIAMGAYLVVASQSIDIASADQTSHTPISQQASKPKLTVSRKFLENNKPLVKRIVNSQFMNHEEKQEWLTHLPDMKDHEIRVLMQILEHEQKEHREFDGSMKDELREGYAGDGLKDLSRDERKSFLNVFAAEYYDVDSYDVDSYDLGNMVDNHSYRPDSLRKYFREEQKNNIRIDTLAILKMGDRDSIEIYLRYLNRFGSGYYIVDPDYTDWSLMYQILDYKDILEKYQPGLLRKLLTYHGGFYAIDVFDLGDDELSRMYVQVNVKPEDVNTDLIKKVSEKYPDKLALFTSACKNNEKEYDSCIEDSLIYGGLDLLIGYLKPNPEIWRENSDGTVTVHFGATMYAQAYEEGLITDDELNVIYDLFVDVVKKVEQETRLTHTLKKEPELIKYVAPPSRNYASSSYYYSSSSSWGGVGNLIDVASLFGGPKGMVARFVIKEIGKELLRGGIRKGVRKILK